MSVENPTSILDLLRREWGVAFTEEIDPLGIVDADATNKRMLTRDGSRIALFVANLSASAIVVIRPGVDPATTTNGIRINTAGTFFATWKEDGTLPASEWQIISDAGNTALFIVTYRIAP